ncbi:uncharacterized protein LOC130546313 isoform X2 [Triplophysa rosa]|uniref:Uncharacterized protein n=1 Tax=Triplophysa rosa TaxID=992332 RepID=A0A9W7WCP6_TRIRA|nr:uncharacterized protein LOC130546313 isoform X2 [Triplophysa rosa]KAI7793113.1 hypothetical protein IRJ41_005287 [Triplophysa rosa]
MNLYKNFGNLFENWVTEGSLDLHYHTGAGVDGFNLTESDSVSRDFLPISNIKSESEDSGFETVSTISPCHSHQVSQLTDHGSPEDDVQPSSPAPSVCSSSSSCVSLGSVAPRNTCLKVEQALRRTEQTSGHVTRKGPQHQMESRVPAPRYRCNTASFPTSCHTNNFREHHRFSRPRRIHSQPPDHKKAELYRKHWNRLGFEEAEQRRLDKLSPGLLYLEQVCRMLENIAKLQQQNHNLQKEVENLKSQHAETECARLNEKAINYLARQRLEVLAHEDSSSLSTFSEEPAPFRHRSVSDTRASLGRQRRAGFAQDESFAGVLFEEPDSNDPPPQHESKKPSKIQKIKFTSLRRQETQKPPQSKSDQPKKKTKLSNFFRSRRMTTRL